MIVLANLDQEARWGHQVLPQHVARRISAAAALVGALAPAGEAVEVWAPAEVDPARLRLPVTMRVGKPARWDLAWADPDAKAVNDRRFALAVAQQIDAALPAARAVDSQAQLDAVIAELGAAPWVAKAAWTAAGRDRVRGQGSPTDEQRVYLGRLLERVGALVVEPWCERLFDLGVCAWPASSGGKIERPHTLLVDARGGFAGIDTAEPPLTKTEHQLLDEAVAAVRAALGLVGYTGPFTVDAFVYRAGAERRLHPICEINARYSFGHVARALGARTLGFGGTPPAGADLLVAPTADDPFSAWRIPTRDA